jgi:hypothetical protein
VATVTGSGGGGSAMRTLAVVSRSPVQHPAEVRNETENESSAGVEFRLSWIFPLHVSKTQV